MIKSQVSCTEEELSAAQIIEKALQDAGYDPKVYAFKGHFFQVDLK